MLQSGRFTCIRFLLIAILFSFALSIPTPQPALAAAFDVDTTLDSNAPAYQACTAAPNDCSLRGALTQANNMPGADVINVPAGVYVLTGAADDQANASGDLDILDDVTIRGAGAASTIIDGNGIDRVFDVNPFGGPRTVTITRLTVQNGYSRLAPGTFWGGGGVLNHGGPMGGGSLTLTNVIVTQNRAEGSGGGIGCGPGASMTLNSVTITRNRSLYSEGGGIDSWSATTISYSTIAYNVAAANGGGIAFAKDNYTILNSTIAHNSASQRGGGLHLDTGARTRIENSTVSGNMAGGDGGGIATATDMDITGASETRLIYTTVVENQAGGTGGGVFNRDADVPRPSTDLQYSLVGDNTQSDCGGTLNSSGYNLVADPSGCTFLADATDQTDVEPLVSPLEDNGGATLTHGLYAESPALDAIPTPCGGPPADQRDILRPQDGDNDSETGCDMGAVEMIDAPPAPIEPGAPAAAPPDMLPDLDGSTNPIVRADVPPGTVTGGSVYGRVVDDNPAQIGNMDVINMGVIHAVDVFSMAGSTSVLDWNSSIKICLLGSGRLMFLDAKTSPRALSELAPVTYEGGYTCAALYGPGTVVLVP
ncbi:MAG: hypothetical protein JXJ20_01765 [Anaerolineae bacterium]|nr:hypothetical protein [Anaerolineae bacterium]